MADTTGASSSAQSQANAKLDFSGRAAAPGTTEDVGPFSTNAAYIETSLGSQGASSMYAWVMGYTVMWVLLWLMNKTRIGHAAIYYSLMLMIVFTLVTHPQEIADALKVFGTTVTTSTPAKALKTIST